MNTDLLEIFSKNLIFLRDLKGIKQTRIAEFLNVRPSNYNNWESGLNFPKNELLVKISRYYDVSIDSLLTEDLSKKENTPYKNKGLSLLEEPDIAYQKSSKDLDQTEIDNLLHKFLELNKEVVEQFQNQINTLRQEIDQLKKGK